MLFHIKAKTRDTGLIIQVEKRKASSWTPSAQGDSSHMDTPPQPPSKRLSTSSPTPTATPTPTPKASANAWAAASQHARRGHNDSMAKLRTTPKYAHAASPQTPQAAKPARSSTPPPNSAAKSTPGSCIAVRAADPTKLQEFLEWLALGEVDGSACGSAAHAGKEEDGVTVTTVHQVICI